MTEATCYWSKSLDGVKRLYRYVEKEAYAKDIINGNFYISTLDSFRNAEGALRRDENEGVLEHELNLNLGKGPIDPEVRRAAEQTGAIILPENAEGIQINGVISAGQIDAWALCTTVEDNPGAMEATFGKWCLALNRPQAFFNELTQALFYSDLILRGFMDLTSYQGRRVKDMEIMDKHWGYLKPVDQYAPQKEVRMLWEARPQVKRPLHPITMKCSHLASYWEVIRSP